MSTEDFGSLNDKSEDKDSINDPVIPGANTPYFKPKAGTDGLADLRMKLGRKTVPNTQIDKEGVVVPETKGPPAAFIKNIGPTHEQLVATGEEAPLPGEEGPNAGEGYVLNGGREGSFDIENDGEGENNGDGGNGTGNPAGNAGKGGSTGLINQDQSVSKQIEEGLLNGATVEELVLMGYNKRSVQTIKSTLKSKMQNQGGGGSDEGGRGNNNQGNGGRGKGMTIFAKGAPPEAIIDAIELPDVSGEGGRPFEQGLKFGMSLVILGVRVAQELSAIGVTQAKPIVDMAKSMREGEAVAAKAAATSAASEVADMMSEQFVPILAGLQGGQNALLQKADNNNNNNPALPPGTDPMKAMMAKTMQPFYQNMMNMMMGTMTKMIPGGGGVPQITDGKTPPVQPDNTPQGWKRRSE